MSYGELWSMREFQIKSGVRSRTTVYKLIADGKLDARKFGHKLVFTAASARDLIDNLPKANLKGGAK